METACGSLTYAAPEVIAGKVNLKEENNNGQQKQLLLSRLHMHTLPFFKKLTATTIEQQGYLGPKADVWSLGCVLYVLLTGALPFDGANDFEVIPKIRKGKFQDSTFLNEDNMRELITCMLNPDPNKRAHLEDIQKHPWAWSDKSMLAMLVRPFANALSSRRKMGTRTTSSINTFLSNTLPNSNKTTTCPALNQGFDWSADSAVLPTPHTVEKTKKKPPLTREISSISDSELSEANAFDKPAETRIRGKSLADQRRPDLNKINTNISSKDSIKPPKDSKGCKKRCSDEIADGRSFERGRSEGYESGHSGSREYEKAIKERQSKGNTNSQRAGDNEEDSETEESLTLDTSYKDTGNIYAQFFRLEVIVVFFPLYFICG